MTGIGFRTVTWSVNDVLRRFPQLRMDPDYQREGNIWSLSRRQLFIDSILNGFDSPKVYLHELVPPEFAEESLQRYAVIDGRQRLEALRAFSEGHFALGADFRLLSEDAYPGMDLETAFGDLAGGPFAQLTLLDLKYSNQTLARRFHAYPLTVVIVSTDDISYIEELFFRLNEGSPLTAAEKRNRGELLRSAVAALRAHGAFSLFSINNRRGRHNDLAVRFLFFEEHKATIERVPDMRARALDDFAASFRPPVGQTFESDEQSEVARRLSDLSDGVRKVLDAVEGVFLPSDHLLKLTGDVLTVYVVLRSDLTLASRPGLRQAFEEFFIRAGGLQGLDEELLTSDELNVLDYFGAVQGTTTGSYLAERARLVYGFVMGDLKLRKVPERSPRLT